VNVMLRSYGLPGMKLYILLIIFLIEFFVKIVIKYLMSYGGKKNHI